MPKKTKKSKESPSPKKENKLLNNLTRVITQCMSGRGYRPMTADQLMQRLGLPAQHHTIFHQILTSFIEEGHVEIVRGRCIWKQSEVETVKGIVRMHPRGFGFVHTEDPTLYSDDIFIPKHLTMNAVDGDTVEVIVNTEAVSEKGPEGRIVSILTRGRTHLAGTILNTSRLGENTAYVPLLGSSQRVVVETEENLPLKAGDRVVMEVIDWGSKETETLCRLSHIIGHISDPSVDIKAAIEEFELRDDFPSKALQEARSFGNKVTPKSLADREDLRDITCVTIDPDTAKDFDDAISISRDKQGRYHMGVHIADVSHYVTPGSALDKEAKQRCNSTYFPGTCIPMLPGELSDNLCSLKPNVLRLTASVHMTFDSEGTLIDYRISRSVIKSAKRFTYREAKQVLDGKKKSPHSAMLKLMTELCGLLKKKRYERGSIEFSMPELVVLVDEKGVPQGTDYVEYDITHQMVEEFMLKANEVVATHLSKNGKNVTYRVHEEPASENLRDFALLARAFGFTLSDTPAPDEIQQMFEEAMQTPYGQYLASCYIRRMKMAVYTPENIGHYGLGLEFYCHFTSPIRRYIDLVVHRILFGDDDDRRHLEMIALQCSEQERISARAEGNVTLLKKLRLIDSVHTKEPKKQYDAVVTRVKPFGITIEIIDFMLESFIHVSELGSDYYVFEEKGGTLRGVRSGKGFHCGDKMTVMLKEVDFITLESAWNIVGEGKPSRTASRPRDRGRDRDRDRDRKKSDAHAEQVGHGRSRSRSRSRSRKK